jgi:hypothetical protein
MTWTRNPEPGEPYRLRSSLISRLVVDSKSRADFNHCYRIDQRLAAAVIIYLTDRFIGAKLSA